MIIEVNDLHKSFGDHEVLSGIDFSVAEQEVVCVIGPSGSGKSTFLRCLNLLEDVSSGEVVIDGNSLTDKRVKIDQVRAEIGMVFQQFNLFPHKSVIENIMLAPMKVRGLNRSQARERGRALLQKVGLAEKEDAYPASLSGGQQQRVAIARALAMEPKIMLFDEPTSTKWDSPARWATGFASWTAACSWRRAPPSRSSTIPSTTALGPSWTRCSEATPTCCQMPVRRWRYRPATRLASW